MKRIKLIISVVILSAGVYLGYAAYDKLSATEHELLMSANIEALTQGGVTLTCDEGDQGRCHEPINEQSSVVDGVTLYSNGCRWTGRGADYCLELNNSEISIRQINTILSNT